jgi:methylated-DNA-[protein]-cysteine S-methyltransferase
VKASLHGKRDRWTTKAERNARIFEIYYQSPLGTLKILGHAYAIWEVEFCKTKMVTPDDSVPEMLWACKLQLGEYFSGNRQVFDLRLEPRGTAFQKRVWCQLVGIPYGETRSYRDIARDLGNNGAARAVGMANARNPISVIIPCHRVIGVNVDLVGYGGGLWRKRWLLDHEKRFLPQNYRNRKKL